MDSGQLLHFQDGPREMTQRLGLSWLPGHKPTKVRLTRHQEDRGPVQTEQVLDHEVSRQGHQEVQEAGLTRVFQI